MKYLITQSIAVSLRQLSFLFDIDSMRACATDWYGVLEHQQHITWFSE